MRCCKTLILALSLGLSVTAPLLSTSRDIHEQILQVSRLINKNRDNLRLYQRRAALHRQNHDWPAAMTDYGRIESINPAYPELGLLRALTWLEAGRPDAARPLLESFLFEHPAHTEALIARAEALALLASPSAAAADLEKVIEQLDPAPPELYIKRATYQARIDGGCSPQVMAGLTEGMDRMGSPPVLVKAAIEFDLQCRRWKQALAHLERLPHAMRAQVGWLVRRAEILEAGQQIDAARRTYMRARRQLRSMNSDSRAQAVNVALARRIDAALDEL